MHMTTKWVKKKKNEQPTYYHAVIHHPQKGLPKKHEHKQPQLLDLQQKPKMQPGKQALRVKTAGAMEA